MLYAYPTFHRAIEDALRDLPSLDGLGTATLAIGQSGRRGGRSRRAVGTWIGQLQRMERVLLSPEKGPPPMLMVGIDGWLP